MNKKMLQKIGLALIISFFALHIQAQKVKVNNTTKKGNSIVVEYEIKGAEFNQLFDVSLYVSRDGGNNFEGPMKSVTGDVGKNITPGEHSITWDVFKDVNSLEGNIVFDVKAVVIEQKVEKNLFVSWYGSLAAPLGVMVGKIGKTGWYGAIRTNFVGSADYTYSDDWDPEFGQAQYYVFNSTEKSSRFSITGGINRQFLRNFFVFAGAGYGSRKLLWQIDIYDYDSDSKSSDAYVENPDNSYSGLELEGGCMLKVNKLLFSLGLTNVGFKHTNIMTGVGLAF